MFIESIAPVVMKAPNSRGIIACLVSLRLFFVIIVISSSQCISLKVLFTGACTWKSAIDTHFGAEQHESLSHQFHY